MPGRWVHGPPRLGSSVERLPDGAFGHGQHQGVRVEFLYQGFAAGRIGDQGHDEATALVVLPRLGQFPFGRIDDRVHLPGHDPDGPLHACPVPLDTEMIQEIADTSPLARAMAASKTAHRPIVTRFDVEGEAGDRIPVFMTPGTG